MLQTVQTAAKRNALTSTVPDTAGGSSTGALLLKGEAEKVSRNLTLEAWLCLRRAGSCGKTCVPTFGRGTEHFLAGRDDPLTATSRGDALEKTED